MQKEKVEQIAKWGLGIGAVIVAGALAMVVFTSIVAIAAAGVAGLAVINFAPVVARKFASWKVNALQHDAQKNPVPNLIALAQKEQDKINKHRAGVTQFSMTTKNFKAKMEGYRAKGAAGVADMEIMYENMKRALAFQIDKLQDALEALEVFKGDITKASDAWQIALDLKAANEAMSIMTEEDPLDTFLRNSSFDAITSKLNHSTAALEMSMSLDYRHLPSDAANVKVVSIDDLSLKLKSLEAA